MAKRKLCLSFTEDNERCIRNAGHSGICQSRPLVNNYDDTLEEVDRIQVMMEVVYRMVHGLHEGDSFPLQTAAKLEAFQGMDLAIDAMAGYRLARQAME